MERIVLVYSSIFLFSLGANGRIPMSVRYDNSPVIEESVQAVLTPITGPMQTHLKRFIPVQTDAVSRVICDTTTFNNTYTPCGTQSDFLNIGDNIDFDFVYNPTQNEYFVAWVSSFTGNDTIGVARVNPDGSFIGSPASFASNSQKKINPSVAWNSARNEYLVGFLLFSNVNLNYNLARQQFSATGALISTLRTTTTGGNETNFRVHYGGNLFYGVHDYYANSSLSEIRIQKFDTVLANVAGLIQIQNPTHNLYRPWFDYSAAYNTSILTYYVSYTSTLDHDVVVVQVDGSGAFALSNTSTIATTNLGQPVWDRNPQVYYSTTQGKFIVFWESDVLGDGTGSVNVMAKFVDLYGIATNPTITITSGSPSVRNRNFRVALNPTTDQYAVIYQADAESEPSNIRIAKLTSNLLTATDIMVVNNANYNTELNPVIGFSTVAGTFLAIWKHDPVTQITTDYYTTGEVTSGDYTSGEVTSAGLTTSRITSGSVTSGRAITSSRITSAALTTSRAGQTTGARVTTGPITSSELTSGSVTSSPLTTGISASVTSSSLTSASLTTFAITSGSLTTFAITSGSLTTFAITSGSLTTFAITSGSLTTSPDPLTTSSPEIPSENPRQSTGIIVGSAVGVAILIGIAIGVVFFIKKRKEDSNQSQQIPMKDLDRNSGFINLQVPFKSIALKEKLGTGAFGVVYRGIFKHTEVAVKRLQTEDEVSDEFLREAEIAKSLPPHPNVVSLRAVTLPPDPICLVFEYCSGGSLRNYLHSHRGQLSLEEMITIATDIAKGMLHLHTGLPGHEVIHRDLAARNILFKKDGSAAISDFGLARIKEGDEAAKTASNSLPLKWTAPESLKDRKYSTKSDVFSYGVVVYEIVAQDDPWPEFSGVQVVSKVVAGERMQIPTHCPEVLKKVVESCWKQDPTERPTFEQIVLQLVPETTESAPKQSAVPPADSNYKLIPV